jgi:hypothetical protein
LGIKFYDKKITGIGGVFIKSKRFQIMGNMVISILVPLRGKKIVNNEKMKTKFLFDFTYFQSMQQ